MQILITGILLGGVYAIIAVGLSLQYGVARIMNLALGEMLVAGAFAAFWFATAQSLNPYWALLVVVPGGFIANWLIYQCAISVDPKAASLVAIDVEKTSAFAFALGGAVAATGGLVLSTFLTFDASIGIVFTLKALIIVIMGGVGDIRGAVVAALVLGITETIVARLIDPGLTLAAAYVLFLLILLFRPQGLFGRAQA